GHERRLLQRAAGHLIRREVVARRPDRVETQRLGQRRERELLVIDLRVRSLRDGKVLHVPADADAHAREEYATRYADARSSRRAGPRKRRMSAIACSTSSCSRANAATSPPQCGHTAVSS